MQRYMAFDVGEKRIGIAVSDPLGITAQGLETYRRGDSPQKDADYLLQVARKYSPVRLVFGMPRNMDGSYGFQAEHIREFADLVLQNWDGEWDFYDERLTTVAAERVLIDAGMSRQKRRGVVDKVAAVVILQGYLERIQR